MKRQTQSNKLTLATLLCLLTVACPAVPKDSISQIAAIRKLVDGPNAPHCQTETYRNLLAQLNSLVKSEPANAELYYLRALVTEHLNNLKEAKSDLDKAIELKPDYAKAYWMLGVIVYMSGHFEEALEDFNKAVTNGEKSGALFMNRGSALQQLGKQQQAIQEFDKAITISPELWPARLMRSNSFLHNHNYAAAIKDCDAILAAKGVPPAQAANAHEFRAIALQQEGKFEESIGDLTQAATAYTGKQKGKMLYFRAFACHKLGREADSRKDLELAHQEGYPPGQASPDRPVHSSDAEESARLEAAIKPLVQKARATLGQAKARYLKGLPTGYVLEVTTKIFDNCTPQHFESVFVRVDSWNRDEIVGTLVNQVQLQNHKRGESLKVKESDVLDWTIVGPEGTEEGNLIGKFLDNWKP